jgi:hypothetical protein
VGRHDSGAEKGALGDGSPKHGATTTIIYKHTCIFYQRLDSWHFKSIDEAYSAPLPPWDDFPRMDIISCTLYVHLLNMHDTLSPVLDAQTPS